MTHIPINGPRAQTILDKRLAQEGRGILRVQEVEAIQSKMVKRPLTPEQEAARKRFHTPISQLRNDPVAAPPIQRPMTKRELCARDCGCNLTVCRRYGYVRD